MSSEKGMEFGTKNQDKYAKVLEKWTGKVDDVSEVNSKLEAQWGNDLVKAMADPVIAALTDSSAINQWLKHGVTPPSKEVLKMFSKIAVKYSLSLASPDLLRRLVRSVKVDKVNPEPSPITASNTEHHGLTAATAATGAMRPSELASRAPQTVAQIYDMAKDRFNDTMNRYFQRNQQFTGKRKWVASGDNSRHSMLDGVVKDSDEDFTYKKKNIAGPRPVGGNPADWSNCSCRISYQRSNGKWVDVTD